MVVHSDCKFLSNFNNHFLACLELHTYILVTLKTLISGDHNIPSCMHKQGLFSGNHTYVRSYVQYT